MRGGSTEPSGGLDAVISMQQFFVEMFANFEKLELSRFNIANRPVSLANSNTLNNQVVLVFQVLSMLINVAYKSSRVLRELQMESIANPNMHQQQLKAK